MHICSSCFRKRDVVQEASDVESRKQKQGEEPQTRFYCCGRIPPEGLGIKRHGMSVSPSLTKSSSVEIASEAYEADHLDLTEIVNPSVPFVENLPEELYQGRSIEIRGKLLENPTRFSINLSTGKENNADIALHFNPRFDRRVIIRNHRIKNKWGVEEIASLQPFPFTIGRNFSVIILVADEQFLIAVNKVHYCAFAYRIPVDRIKTLIVLGDLVLNLVQHCYRSQYPPRIFSTIPYIIIPPSPKNDTVKCVFKRKVKVIKTGTQIDIFGRLKVLPRAFYVNLQKGIDIWPHPEIPFHMNFRLHQPGTYKTEREIIFNSWSRGSWNKEEIITFCPFLPGNDFHIKIKCRTNGYHVFVNEKFLFHLGKKTDVDVDAVIIHGDVFISKVVIH